MTALHVINGCAWLANSVVWLVYAHSWPMGLVSIIATGVAFWMARASRDYYF